MTRDGNVQMIEAPKMYEAHKIDGVLYGFGPSWIAMAMFMDDYGYKTKEEAVLAWYKHIYKEGKDLDADYGNTPGITLNQPSS